MIKITKEIIDSGLKTAKDITVVIILGAIVAVCVSLIVASEALAQQVTYSGQGTVEIAECTVSQRPNSTSRTVTGAGVGAIAGGILGNVIGGRDGRNLGAAIGGVGGGVAGNALADTVYQCNVVATADDGTTHYSALTAPRYLTVGERVKIVKIGSQTKIFSAQ
jgi:outer membrane lipoprotein SlyB